MALARRSTGAAALALCLAGPAVAATWDCEQTDACEARGDCPPAIFAFDGETLDASQRSLAGWTPADRDPLIDLEWERAADARTDRLVIHGDVYAWHRDTGLTCTTGAGDAPLSVRCGRTVSRIASGRCARQGAL